MGVKTINIGNRIIGEGRPCFIIAEIGLNHNGMVHIAKSLIDAAFNAKVDAVKFQKRDLAKIYRQEILNNPALGEQSMQYLIPIIKEYELSDDDFVEIAEYCKQKGVMFLCTPWDKKSADFLNNLDVPAFKVASADFINFDLLEYLVTFKKPLILSTGMCVFDEVIKSVEFLKKLKAEFILLHCNSSYPAPFHNINLNFMKRLREEFDVPVGYSGHELGIAVSEAAVVMGANVLERHITMDRTMRGPDHASSLEPQGFTKLVRDVRNIEQSFGLDHRWLTRGEFANRESLAKSLVADCSIKKGAVIARDMVVAKSPGKGVSPQRIYELVGTTAKRDIAEDEEFKEQDFNVTYAVKRDGLVLTKNWGVVVRFPDVEMLADKRISILEFHLSDQDLKAEPKLKNYAQELVVHAPEYWGDYLLDPASGDSKIRSMTVDILNQTILLVKKISPHFKKSSGKGPKLVLHPGGMSRDWKPQLKKTLLQNLLWTLQELQSEGVEILLENMPPLPWYFGGQWRHNIFVEPDEIIDFLKSSGYSMCFDVSHAKLASNYLNIPMDDYVKFLPFTLHIHIADAAGVDGEGLQIGDGEVDFKQLLAKFSSFKHGFIPEIWQGHKFGGEGYWIAIEKLEKIFSGK